MYRATVVVHIHIYCLSLYRLLLYIIFVTVAVIDFTAGTLKGKSRVL